MMTPHFENIWEIIENKEINIFESYVNIIIWKILLDDFFNKHYNSFLNENGEFSDDKFEKIVEKIQKNIKSLKYPFWYNLLSIENFFENNDEVLKSIKISIIWDNIDIWLSSYENTLEDIEKIFEIKWIIQEYIEEYKMILENILKIQKIDNLKEDIKDKLFEIIK